MQRMADLRFYSRPHRTKADQVEAVSCHDCEVLIRQTDIETEDVMDRNPWWALHDGIHAMKDDLPAMLIYK